MLEIPNLPGVLEITNSLYYLLCFGTVNRDIILSDVLSEIWLLRDQYLDCYCILARDFNVNLDDKHCNQFSLAIKQFIEFHYLSRCDSALDFLVKFTYCNEAQGHYSKLDYYLTSDTEYTTDFKVFDMALLISLTTSR